MTTIVQIAKDECRKAADCDGKYSAGDSRDGCVSGQTDCKGDLRQILDQERGILGLL